MENKQRLAVRWLWLIFACVSSSALWAQGQQRAQTDNVRLIVAHVDRVRLVEPDRDPSAVAGLNKFQITMSDVAVIHGRGDDIRGAVKSIIYGNDLFGMKGERVAFLVSYTSKKDFKVLTWRPIDRSVCIPADLVDRKYEDYYWDSRRRDGEKCVSVGARIEGLFGE